MNPPPTPGDASATQVVRSDDSRLPEPFADCKTFGEMLRRLYEEPRTRTQAVMAPEFHEKFWRHRLGCFEKWPDWALRIAAEVFHVQFPTIPKETVENAFRTVNHFVFVARIDGGPMEPAPKFPDLNPTIAGAIVGHSLAMVLDLRRSIEEARDILTPEKYEEFSRRASLEDFQKQLTPLVSRYFDSKPLAFVEFQEGFSHARRNTFDKHGSLKETPLTPVYREILGNWPEIERLSGPKALTEYLSPLLGNQDFEDQYERVKKICQRMEITFKPFVKGQ